MSLPPITSNLYERVGDDSNALDKALWRLLTGILDGDKDEPEMLARFEAVLEAME